MAVQQTFAKEKDFAAIGKVGFGKWAQRFLIDLPESKFPLKGHQKVITRFMAGTPYRGGAE